MKSIRQFWRGFLQNLAEAHEDYMNEQKGDSGLE